MSEADWKALLTVAKAILADFDNNQFVLELSDPSLYDQLKAAVQAIEVDPSSDPHGTDSDG